MQKFGRRAFLVILAVVGAAFGIFRSRHSIKVFFTGAERKAKAADGPAPYRGGAGFPVAAAGGGEVKDMVRVAVSLIGGFGQLDPAGKKVLVKPNVVGERANPTTTSPEVVKATVELLYEAGAARVYVGDMSALTRGATPKNMERTGIDHAARSAGAETVYFEDHGWVKVKVNGRYLQEVDVSEWFFNVDRVINLPVIKTHRYAGYSICLKNFVGGTHFSQRPYIVDRGHWEEVVAELNLAYRPDLNIVDGTKIMVSGGPWEGETAATNLILAGGDRVACDVVGLAIIKTFGRWKPLADTSPWRIRQLRRAVELGLGARQGSDVELRIRSLGDNPEFSELMDEVRSMIQAG
jgi:uncharacterized protein (DUF362 family)